VEAQAQGGVVTLVSGSQLQRQSDRGGDQPKHPAAEVDNLPEEVQGYINRIESELYDQKQDGLAARAFFVSALGAAMLFLDYKGGLGAPTILSTAAAMFLLVWPWLYYWYQWKKNAEEHLPSDIVDRPCGPTDEGIRQEWEINYLAYSRGAARRSAERNASPQ
jgi:hypothetical protein